MKISRERKIYGLILGVSVAALCADRMLFDVPWSGPVEVRAETQAEESTTFSNPKPAERAPSLKRRIESFRDLSPASAEDAFAMRGMMTDEAASCAAAMEGESVRPEDSALFTLRAVGGVGTDRAFARVNDALLRPGETDEHGLTLVSLEKREHDAGEEFLAIIRTLGGREVELRMAIGGTD